MSRSTFKDRSSRASTQRTSSASSSRRPSVKAIRNPADKGRAAVTAGYRPDNGTKLLFFARFDLFHELDLLAHLRQRSLSILATIARQERIRLSERTIAGLEQARRMSACSLRVRTSSWISAFSSQSLTSVPFAFACALTFA
jgi:hypothetical protein